MKRSSFIGLSRILGGLLALAAVSSAGCSDRPQIWTTGLAVTGPFKVGAQAVWVDGTRGIAFALDAQSSPPAFHSVAIERNVLTSVTIPTTGQLLIASAGREAVKKDQQPEPPTLTLLTPKAGTAPDITRTWPLSAPFDRLAVSPDGKTAIAWFSGTATSDSFFINPNELATIDLTSAASANNPAIRTIRSLGATPIAVVFSPPMPVPAGTGAPRSLALVLSDNYLTFLDLNHAERPEITVPLRADGSTTTITPQQVIFSADTATIFIRASGASDVYALALQDRPGADASVNDYLPLINQPSAGKVALDMMLYHEGAKTLILTANDSQDLALIDAATSEFAVLPMGVPVDAILPIPADAPTTAILFSRLNPQSAVYFLDLTNLSTNLGQNLTRRALAKPVHDLVPVPGGDQLLVVHDDSRTVISILDLGPHRTDTPIEGHLPLDSFDFAGGFLVGVSAGLNQLGLLDMSSLSPTSLRLDYAPKKVIALDKQIVIDHGASQGLVTVVPNPQATRDDSHVLWGFLLEGLLDGNPRD